MTIFPWPEEITNKPKGIRIQSANILRKCALLWPTCPTQEDDGAEAGRPLTYGDFLKCGYPKMDGL